MQAIRPFIRPVLTATIGAMAGYGLVQKGFNKEPINKPNLPQLLSVLVGIGTPVYLGLSTVPALITSFLISGLGTLALRNDDKSEKKEDVTEVKSPPPLLPEKIQKSVDAFSESFKSADKFGKQISDEFTKNFNALSSPDEKIKCIQGIFTAFKNSSYTKVFNNSEIWTFLLKQLSEQTAIDEKQQITLDVADSNNGKINFNVNQLKGFLESLEYDFPAISESILLDTWHQWRYNEIKKKEINFPSITLNEVNTIFDCNPDTTDINNNILKKYNINTKEKLQIFKNQYDFQKFKDEHPDAEKNSNDQIIMKAESEVEKFVSNLNPNKPFMKILNHNNAHYTGMVIEKNTDDTFSVSHINSIGQEYKFLQFQKDTCIEYIKTLIKGGNGTEDSLHTKYEQFFGAIRGFEIPSDNITGLVKGDINTFTPFGQDSCTCHQMSVMNLLKYYVEKCNKQVRFKTET